METLKVEFEQCLGCGRWYYRANLEDLKDVPPSVVRFALQDELELWETVQREEDEKRRLEHYLQKRRN